MVYDVLKALHIVAVIAWMAGLLYLPRLFVYHADAETGSTQSETFKVMERRLYHGIMNPAMIGVWLFGLALAWQGEWWHAGWWQMKFALAAGLTVETDATELVLDAHGLACAECHRLVKIPRNLFLAGICGSDGLRREEQHRGEQSPNQCETQQRSPENGWNANHYGLASKTSSSVCCFS